MCGGDDLKGLVWERYASIFKQDVDIATWLGVGMAMAVVEAVGWT